MAVKVTIEGTGTWVGLKRGVRQAGLLTPRIEQRIQRGFVREVERIEIPDTPSPAPVTAEDAPAGPADSGSTTPSDESPEPPATEAPAGGEAAPPTKGRRTGRTRSHDTDG